MSGNRKDWRWCRCCHRWVFEFPLVGQWCGDCWLDWLNTDKDRAEARAASDYLLADYAANC